MFICLFKIILLCLFEFHINLLGVFNTLCTGEPVEHARFSGTVSQLKKKKGKR